MWQHLGKGKQPLDAQGSSSRLIPLLICDSPHVILDSKPVFTCKKNYIHDYLVASPHKHVDTYEHTHTCMHMYIRITHEHPCEHTHTCMHMYIRITHEHPCEHTHTCMHMYIRITHVHPCEHTHACMCTYVLHMYIHVNIHMHACVHTYYTCTSM